MTKRLVAAALIPLALAGCEVAPTSGAGGTTAVSNLPENIMEMAAPHQDLSRARVDEATGCYVYLHSGPVENTYLPLRTRDGRPICTEAMASVKEAN